MTKIFWLFPVSCLWQPLLSEFFVFRWYLIFFILNFRVKVVVCLAQNLGQVLV